MRDEREPGRSVDVEGGTPWNRASTGLKNYWYPVCGSRDVKSRYPTRFQRLGFDVAIVRRNGVAYTFLNECPHRGYVMHDGKGEFPGSDTISCRIHGFTYDLAQQGSCVAVLTDGPESAAVGKFRLRMFPTQERKGIIWVWFGRGEPAPIEEDVSPHILEEATLVKFRYSTVYGNWRMHAQQEAGHFPMLHRDSIGLQFLQIMAFAEGNEPFVAVDEQDGAEYLVQSGRRGGRVEQADYPNLGTWPPNRWWRFISNSRGRPLKGVPFPGGSFRLPATLRVVHYPFEGGMLWEWYVPEDEDHYTYFQLTAHWPRNPLSWLYTQFWYYVWGRPLGRSRSTVKTGAPSVLSGLLEAERQ